MPIYEYLCEGCGRISEVMQKISEPGPKKCPECGSRKIAKLVSRTAFQLKGGGWYSDLYASTKKDAKPAESAPSTGGPASTPAPAPKTPTPVKAAGGKSDR